MNWLCRIYASDLSVPSLPGSVSVPADHVRLYHYFPFAVIDSIRTKGIDIGSSRGESYGEPNVVWASCSEPSQSHSFVEFSVSMNDVRWLVNKPSNVDDIHQMENYGSNVYFGDSIGVDEFIAIHEPWHRHYRYIESSSQVRQEVLSGEYDHLLSESEYGPAILAIKKRFRDEH